MSKIPIDRSTVEQALEALEGGADSWQRVGPAIDALRAALAEPVQEPEPQEIADLRQACKEGWRYADELDQERKRLQEKLRAALVEQQAEPVAWLYRGNLHPFDPSHRASDPATPLYAHPPQRPAEPQGCDHCEHPLYAAIKCRVCGRVTEPAPPQRKPLAEWQINDLMADIDPEDRDSWSFRQGVYAAEKHHGVRK